MHKFLLPIIVAGFGVSVGHSQTFTDGEWTYTLNKNNEATITFTVALVALWLFRRVLVMDIRSRWWVP